MAGPVNHLGWFGHIDLEIQAFGQRTRRRLENFGFWNTARAVKFSENLAKTKLIRFLWLQNNNSYFSLQTANCCFLRKLLVVASLSELY
jgi:hypothetical protein